MTGKKAKVRVHGILTVFGWLLASHVVLAAGGGVANSDCLLWKVIPERSDTPSYIFGTIHSDDPRVLELPTRVQKAFDNSERLMLEIVTDPESMTLVLELMVRDDKTTLQQDLPPQLHEQTVTRLKKRGLEEGWINRLTVWAAALNFLMPESSGPVLDLQLQMQMQEREKPVLGLESIESQMKIFSEMDKEAQVELLRIALQEYEQLDQMTERLIQYYLQENLTAILQLQEEAYTGKDRAFMKELMERMIDQRNITMVQSMRAQLDAGKTFVAVGALHLPGKKGVINLLQKAGYKVEPVR